MITFSLESLCVAVIIYTIIVVGLLWTIMAVYHNNEMKELDFINTVNRHLIPSKFNEHRSYLARIDDNVDAINQRTKAFVESYNANKKKRTATSPKTKASMISNNKKPTKRVPKPSSAGERNAYKVARRKESDN